MIDYKEFYEKYKSRNLQTITENFEIEFWCEVVKELVEKHSTTNTSERDVDEKEYMNNVYLGLRKKYLSRVFSRDLYEVGFNVDNGSTLLLLLTRTGLFFYPLPWGYGYQARHIKYKFAMEKENYKNAALVFEEFAETYDANKQKLDEAIEKLKACYELETKKDEKLKTIAKTSSNESVKEILATTGHDYDIKDGRLKIKMKDSATLSITLGTTTFATKISELPDMLEKTEAFLVELPYPIAIKAAQRNIWKN